MAKNGYIGVENTYRAVTYIESNGSQYIDTGVFLNEKSSVKMRFEITSTPEQANVFGGRKSATSGNFHLWVNTSGLLTFDYRSYTENRIQRSITTNSLIDISITPTKYVINGTEYAINGTDAFQTPATVLIFNACGDSHTTSKAHIKLYSCEIYNSDTLVRDFVPCINDFSEAGLYDRANGMFYRNVGSGVFAVGAETGEVPISQCVARKISKCYIGVNGVARKITRVYIGDENGIARQCYNGDSDLLVDFVFTDNGDGTFTLTGWGGTFKGKNSTELIIPDDPSIIL